MSIEAMTWALRVPVGGNQKVVLLGLANHAHPDGSEAYPSLDTLAVYAHCDRSTARRNVRKLVEAGWISEDGNGPHRQNRYRLNMARRVDRPAVEVGSTPSLRVCVYCEGTADVLDHVVPQSRGGGNVRNTAPACSPCNGSKGTREVEAWARSTGRDWPAIRQRLEPWIGGWQNATQSDATVADALDAGGSSAPVRVAPTPPEPSLNRPEEENARSASPIAMHLQHLQPLIAAGKLDPPGMDGSDMALHVAVQRHGDELVGRAIDHLAAWASASGAGGLEVRSVRRLLPRALEHADRGAPTAAGGRRSAQPSADDVARFAHYDEGVIG